MSTYLAITPARDEEQLLPGLIDSMAAQTRIATRWIIIDDGSSDSTGELIDTAAQLYPWIEPHHLEGNRVRAEGGESIIMRFLPCGLWNRYKYILRLDADLSFGPDFVELLQAEFLRDPLVGIAGATLYEPDGARWREMSAPSFHTRGAAKMYSGRCFSAIGGLEPGLGWDTVDEAHAMMLGFRTRSYRHIRAYHHRPQGAAGGLWRGRIASGRAAYRAGYAPLFMLVRAARHTFARPYMFAGALMLTGYIGGYLGRHPRAASPELVRFVRKQQMRRLMMMNSLWR